MVGPEDRRAGQSPVTKDQKGAAVKIAMCTLQSHLAFGK